MVKPRENRHTDRFPHDKEHKDIFKLPLFFMDPGYHAMQKEPVEEILDPLHETTLSHSPLRAFLIDVSDKSILNSIEIKCKIKKYGGSACGGPPMAISQLKKALGLHGLFRDLAVFCLVFLKGLVAVPGQDQGKDNKYDAKSGRKDIPDKLSA